MRSPRLPFPEWKPAAFKAASRFAFPFRKEIYRAGAMSQRALQLAEAFPVLALSVYCMSYRYGLGRCDTFSAFAEEHGYGTCDAGRKEASALVERGARLRDVAAVRGVPMVLRRVKPGAAHLAAPWHAPKRVISLMPDSLPRMRIWLCAVHNAHLRAGSDFAEWTARHALHIPLGTGNEILWFLHDLADWVRASDGDYGHEYVVSPFRPTMSLRTVTKLSAEWHEAVASNLTGPQHTFPAPWFPAATINGVEIIPIDNSADLYREGA